MNPDPKLKIFLWGPYNKLAANFLVFIKLATIGLWLGVYESTSWLDSGSGTTDAAARHDEPWR